MGGASLTGKFATHVAEAVMFGSSSSHVGAVIIKLSAALRDLAPMRRVGGWAEFDAPPAPYRRSNSDVDVLSGPIDYDDDDNDAFHESSLGALITAEGLAGVGGADASPPRKSWSYSSTASTSASQRRSSFLLPHSPGTRVVLRVASGGRVRARAGRWTQDGEN